MERPKLCIVLGSSAAALDEFAAARSFLEEQGLDLHVVCVNDAIKVCPVKPIAFCTIHSSASFRFFTPELDLDGVKMYTRRKAHGFAADIVKAKWLGTSGLYAVQIALEELGFDGVILAGVPIDAAAGTMFPEHSLMTEQDRVGRYRPEWLLALPMIKDRVRSMSGWTQGLLGAPDISWLESLAEPRQAAVGEILSA
jgi:hypothetical protein